MIMIMCQTCCGCLKVYHCTFLGKCVSFRFTLHRTCTKFSRCEDSGMLCQSWQLFQFLAVIIHVFQCLVTVGYFVF
jgi:hypothetical protein